MPLTPTRAVAGRYRLGEVLGRGGRATVYEARDALLGRSVALKMFLETALSPEDVQLQQAEARLVAALDHFALTTLFDAGVDTTEPDEPRIFLVMERVRGVDLRKRLRDGPLTAGQVATLGSDLAQGLEAVHEHGFLHRDVKPANVLLAARGPSSRIRGKLTDFGIASIIGGSDPSEYTTGTVAYLSPEQVEGEDASPASDVYALGLVLLEAAIGRTAFPGGVEASALARLDRDPEIPGTVPAALARVLRAMTARAPVDRPTPGEAAVQLQEAFVAGLVHGHRVDPGMLADAEAERLAAVRRYAVLDTGADEAIDRIARVARHALDVPIALVAVIDADRVWLKSHEGVELAQIARDLAFLPADADEGTTTAVEDVQEDPRAAEHPLFGPDPDLHAYATAPLTTFDGHTIGALVVIDRRPRRFTEEERAVLVDLAAVTMRELDLRLIGRRVLAER